MGTEPHKTMLILKNTVDIILGKPFIGSDVIKGNFALRPAFANICHEKDAGKINGSQKNVEGGHFHMSVRERIKYTKLSLRLLCSRNQKMDIQFSDSV